MVRQAEFQIEVGWALRPKAMKEWLRDTAQHANLQIEILEFGRLNKVFYCTVRGDHEDVHRFEESIRLMNGRFGTYA